MTDMHPTRRDAAVAIAARLQEAGHTAYLAGGCVRDQLRGVEPRDFDVATSATPKQVRAVFPSGKFVGESFGVVLVHRKVEGEGSVPFEVATFRLEWGYEDGRRPDKVEFTDAAHDAARRDFTINGLFEDPIADDPEVVKQHASGKPVRIEPMPKGGVVIDYVEGLDDLEAGLIRAVGDADERFGEDYLRMLRAARFAARTGFQIEPTTEAAIRLQSRYLGLISRERIGQEVMAMLEFAGEKDVPAAGGRLRALTLIQQLHLDSGTLSESHDDPELATVARLSGLASRASQLSAWMIDRHMRGDGEGAMIAFFEQDADRVIDRWRDALNLSNDVRDRLRAVFRRLRRMMDWADLPVAQRKRLLASDAWHDALRVAEAIDRPPMPRLVRQVIRQSEPLLAEGVAPPALLDGEDVLALGLKPGPRVGELLEQAYDEQLEGRLLDREAALAWLKAQSQ